MGGYVTMAHALASLNMRGKHVIPVSMDTTKVGLNVSLATAIPMDEGPYLVLMVMENANATMDMMENDVIHVHFVTFVDIAVSKKSE